VFDGNHALCNVGTASQQEGQANSWLGLAPCKKQETQLSLRKADRTAYVRSLASDFQSRRESNFSKVTQFHARYVNGTLLSKATINARVFQAADGEDLVIVACTVFD